MADGLVIRLLGPLRVSAPGGRDTALRGHAAHLLAWLAVHPGQAWSADDLAARLWPAGPPPTARTAIQGHVSKLRRLLGDGNVVQVETVPGGYVLHAEGRASASSPVDADRFAALCTRATQERAAGHARPAADTLDAALALWTGEALAGLRQDPGLAARADALTDQRRDAEDALADALVAAGGTDRALALLARLVDDDPLREHRWALLMMALTKAGRQTDALRAYRRAAAVLVERTGLDPGHELRRLETAILLQDPSLDAARWQPAPGSAPSPLTGVVGRDTERAAVVSRLAAARLVTLTGPGGVGKSTLGIDVAAAAGDTFADGAVVVDLGSSGPDDVGAAVAAAVGAAPPEEPGGDGDAPLARAVAVLARRDVLVVLDGCEHVRDDAARAAVALLQAGPGLRILATSQVPLGVAGEAVVRLEPLGVPAPSADADAIRRAPAAELLARRLDEMGCPVADAADWHHVGAVVRALDGLPLAIEIAAATARAEPLAELARRLAVDTAAVLVAAPPTGAGRRRLGATLDAAVDRLDPETARLYALVSVFPGAFDATGASVVAGVDVADACAGIGRLADASLAVLDGPGRRRARLLQPVRAHASGLLDADAREAAYERLVTWCVELAADLDRTLHTAAQTTTVGRFVDELPTFRMVLRRLVDHDDVDRAAQLFSDLVACWGDSPARPEALAWADELLPLAHRLPPGPRARLEIAVVHAQYAFQLMASKLDLAEEALQLAEQAGDRFSVAAAQIQVAIGLGWRNIDLDRAGELIEACRAGMLALGERYWAAVALEFRGLLALRRLDIAAGIATLEEAAAEHRADGAPGDVAHALTFIGYARRAAGDLSGARRAFDEASRVLGDVRVSTWLRATVGGAHAALALDDLDGAGEAFRSAHDRAIEVGDHRIVGTALVGLAAIARRRGDPDRCVALLEDATDRALDGGDPTDAVAAAGMLAELLVERGATEEAAVVVGATDLVDDQVGVRVDFGLAHDVGPVRAELGRQLGDVRLTELGGDGRLIGLRAAVHRAAERVLGDTERAPYGTRSAPVSRTARRR